MKASKVIIIMISCAIIYMGWTLVADAVRIARFEKRLLETKLEAPDNGIFWATDMDKDIEMEVDVAVEVVAV